MSDLFELVLADDRLRDREQLLDVLCDLEECVHELDDSAPEPDERRRLADAVHAWRRADELLTGAARDKLDLVGLFLCDELDRLPPHDATRD